MKDRGRPPLQRTEPRHSRRRALGVGGQTKGKIVKWHVQVGDCIKENQLLFDVETNTLTVRADHRVGAPRIPPITASELRASVVQSDGCESGVQHTDDGAPKRVPNVTRQGV